jgi:Flp pilus assembly protein TadG
MAELGRDERGLTSTELAVLMPVVIALVLVPFQVGLWWHATQVAHAAAQEAVDTAQVADATEADGVAAATWFLNQTGNLTQRNVSVTRTGDTVTAQVTGVAPRLLFYWGVTATAVGVVEEFVAEPDR